MWFVLLAMAHAQAPPPLSPDARFALALFCNPTCGDDVMDTLDQGLSAIAAKNGFPDDAPKPMRVMGLAGTDFGMPDATFIELYGVGVTRPEALEKSQEVALAWIAGPRDKAVDTFAIAHAAFAAAAAKSGGWVEDLDTQRVYGAEAWAALDPRGPLTDWFVVDADLQDPADEAGPLRLVTRGLRRYGDFELVVEDVAPEDGGDVSYVVNTLATQLHGRAEVPGQLKVDTPEVKGIASFRSIAAREDDPEEPLLRATFKGSITLPPEAAAPPEEAAPPEVAAPPAPAPAAAPPLAAPAPPPAPVAAAPPSPAPAPAPSPPPPPAAASLEEAQRLARERFARVVIPAFLAGLPPGEAVAAKVPFPTRDHGREYMWVELRTVAGANMTGVLLNEPYDVDGLHKGDEVSLSADDLFDYVWKKSDGSREGNTTAKFLN
jgi:hypothetical protein